jgi:hypothetical protein
MEPEIRGLSLTQPWASLVALGAKRMETRSWRTDYRGWLAIQAAKKFPKDDQELCLERVFLEALRPRYGNVPYRLLPLSAIVAVARLTDCLRTEQFLMRGDCPEPDLIPGWTKIALSNQEYAFGNYDCGRWAWVLDDVRELPEPVHCPGALGLWKVPPPLLPLLLKACR